MKLFDGGLSEILLWALACAGMFFLLCMVIGTTVFAILQMVFAIREEVENHRRNNQRGRK